MELHYDYLPTAKGGRKTAVRLPSDNLTPAALARKSGPCRTYRLGKPMSAGQFRSMPHDLRQMYLQRLRSRGGSEEDVGRMMGLTPAQVKRMLKRYRVCLDQPNAARWSTFLRP